VRRAWGPGWALVGDAGYWKDPLGAHGLTAALRDAELLARAVISAATTDEPESVALARYQSTRDRLSRPMFDAMDVVAGQRWADHEIGALLRRISAAMADEVSAIAALDAVPVGVA
jgi:2-polyprenyl-6-methoxyphenol hydroxylase-like FAD-dependent oxidoreductase